MKDVIKIPNQKPDRLSSKRKITFKQAMQAVEDSGFTAIPLRQIEAAALLGRYLEQDIVFTLPSAMHVKSMHDLQATITEIDTAIVNAASELKSEVVAILLGRKAQCIKDYVEIATKIQETAKICGKTMPEQLAPKATFAPREQVVPQGMVQVNVGVARKQDVEIIEMATGSSEDNR